jgi:hypothetical protein
LSGNFRLRNRQLRARFDPAKKGLTLNRARYTVKRAIQEGRLRCANLRAR